MVVIQPDLAWCGEISSGKSLSLRCPYASVHRCPRYYESLSLLGQVGVATSIAAELDQSLLQKWQQSDLWPVTREKAAQVMGPENKPQQD